MFLYVCLLAYLHYLQSELSSIEKQLLSDFLPDDICPLGAQFVEQMPCKNDDNYQDEVLNI